MTPDPLLESLRHRLIVSVQADAGNPMDNPAILSAMAQAVEQGGAAAIRAGGPANIRAIRQKVQVPIFGIYKREYPDSPVYITPTLDEARQVVEAGCDVLAFDATRQSRPGGQTLEDFFQQLKAEFALPLMADVSTLDEGLQAESLGANLVATTLAGYTPYSRHLDGPDFLLVEDLVARLRVPLIVEGRIRDPEDARRALDLGAFAVVVGSMITRPGTITAHFVAGIT
ncbi:MAG: N-acetylmannosamine-6-phosphate 2-epimerase [Anaerolineae bacterium]|nr:N-acetylmannosamine-6-phosphate 2-epimerase [Anaerolineae bacterium]